MGTEVRIAWGVAGAGGSVVRSEVTAAGQLTPRAPFSFSRASAWRAHTPPSATGERIELDRTFAPGSLGARQGWNVLSDALLRRDLLGVPAAGGGSAGYDRARVGVMELLVEVRIGAQQPLVWRFDLRSPGIAPDGALALWRAARSFHAAVRHGSAGAAATPSVLTPG